MKKTLAILLSLCMVVSALTACKAAEPAPAQSSATEPATTGEPATETEAPALEDEIDKGGILVVASTSDPDSMLVTKIRYSSPLGVYEALMEFDETGTPQPLLAESLVGDPAALTYTLTLKPGILFHDGTELTAEVCKWNIDNYKANGILSGSFLSNLESVEVTGDYTLVLHMTNWDCLIPAALCRNAGYMSSQAFFEANGEEYCQTHPCGTGPFMLESWTQGVNATYVKNAAYWQGEPYLDGIEVAIYSTALVAQAALEAGDVHVWQSSDYDIADYLAKEGFTIVKSAIPYCCYALSFNCTGADDPFSDIRVRQAAAYAIDRDAIATILDKEYGVVTNQYVTESSAFYNSDIQGYSYDLEKAKALLAEAGYENGFETTVTVYDNMSALDICLVVKEQLAKVGINVEVNSTDIGSYLLSIDGWGNGMIAHPMTLDNGIDSQLAAIFKKGLASGLGVVSFLHPDDLNESIVKGLASSGDESREHFSEAMRLIFDEYCMVKAIAVNSKVTVQNPNVHDTGIGAISSYSNTLGKAWIEQK